MINQIIICSFFLILSIFVSRYIYEYRYYLDKVNIKKILINICKNTNINIESINVYEHNSFIRYDIITNNYKKIHDIQNILPHIIKKPLLIEIDYNYCYIDVLRQSVYSNTDIIVQQTNSITFNNGYHQNINISLFQNILFYYKNEETFHNFLKYIQSVIMHLELVVYTYNCVKWTQCLSFILSKTNERIRHMWLYSSNFKEYNKYNNDLKPIVIIAHFQEFIKIDDYLLNSINNAGIYLIFVTNNNIEKYNFKTMIFEHEWKNRFILQKESYKSHVYRGV